MYVIRVTCETNASCIDITVVIANEKKKGAFIAIDCKYTGGSAVSFASQFDTPLVTKKHKGLTGQQQPTCNICF